jgi:iron(III) transport system ATP-binding protein
MRAELSRLQKQLAITTVYVTHDQDEAMAISDRIAVMRAGSVAQIGTAEDLYRAPRSAFVAQFIGRVNLVDSTVIAVTGERMTVELWGASLTGPVGPGCGAGARVTLVIRPESLTLVPESTKAGATDVVVAGVVRSRTFLGEKVEYTVEVAGALLHAVAYDPARGGVHEVGARVGVSCDAGAVRPLP